MGGGNYLSWGGGGGFSCSVVSDPVAHQAALSMGSSRQEHWNGFPFPTPGDLPDPGVKPRSPALWVDFFLPAPRCPHHPALSQQERVLTKGHLMNGLILFHGKVKMRPFSWVWKSLVSLTASGGRFGKCLSSGQQTLSRKSWALASCPDGNAIYPEGPQSGQQLVTYM